MYVAEARRQQALMEFQKLVKGKKKPKYPSPFKNHNNEVDLPIPRGRRRMGWNGTISRLFLAGTSLGGIENHRVP